MNLDLNTIHHFISVAEYGSFSKASEALHVSRQVLNKQILRLEEELGSPLFSRNHSSLSLTSVGNTYYLFFKNFIEEFDKFRISLKGLNKQKESSDELRLGIMFGEIPKPSFTEVLSNFQGRYPEVSIVVETHEPYELQKLLVEHKLDMIINYSSEINPSPYIHTIDLWRSRPCIFASRSYHGIEEKTSYRDFSEEPCFITASPLFSPHNQILSFQRLWEEQNVHFSNVVILPNLKSIISNVELGTGITLMTQTSVFAKNEKICAFPFEEDLQLTFVINKMSSDERLKALSDMIGAAYELS